MELELYEQIENEVKELINRVPIVLEHASPRVVGDTLQDILGDSFCQLIPADYLKEYNSSFARRSMADFAFEGVDGRYYLVDCKTHNEETVFNMPNITSVERITKLYEDDTNFFTLLVVKYRLEHGVVTCTDVVFAPIEHLDWSCLTIGALGWGQVQIANSNNIVVNRQKSRKEWMLELCDRLDIFYPKEISKIERRILHFHQIRAYWESK